MFVVDYNWNTRRYYLIGQIKAASNRIALIGVVSLNKKHTCLYMFIDVTLLLLCLQSRYIMATFQFMSLVCIWKFQN